MFMMRQYTVMKTYYLFMAELNPLSRDLKIRN